MNDSVSISSLIKQDFTVENRTETHIWYADEPMDLGGKDEGPKPTELFLSSLASCILITVRMVAQRKGWNTGVISIELTMNHREKGVEIVKHILFENQLEEEQVKRLLDVSNRCPVAKILSNPIEFKFV
jgi:putative redox protein